MPRVKLPRILKQPQVAPRHRPLLVIGHRGAAGDAPENTLAAFDLALEQGADGIEFDVQLSADGMPVVIHDFRLDRTTSGRGRVRDHALDDLKRLDAGSWFNRRYPSRARDAYARLEIPTLAQTLDWVSERGCVAYLEIKQGRVPARGIEAKTAQEIHRAGVASRTFVISFHRPTLERLRRIDPSLGLGIDFTRPILAVRRARLVSALVVLPHWAFASRRFIDRAHRAGIDVVVWDLDQATAMRRKIADGVDGIITAYPARAARLRAALEAGVVGLAGVRYNRGGRAAMKVAKKFRVSGRVQGVGYRFFAERWANQLGLAGYVTNCFDGSVEVYAVGDENAVRELKGHLAEGPRSGRVESIEETDGPVDRRYTRFGIEDRW